MACGERANLVGEVLLDPHGDEVAQATVTSDDSQRSVFSVHKVAGRIYHPVQDGLQAQVFGQCNDGIQKALHPLLGAHQLPGTVNKVGQKFVHPGAGNRLPALCGLTDAFAHGNRLPRYLKHTQSRPAAAVAHRIRLPALFLHARRPV